MSTLRITFAAACVAALAVPVGADAATTCTYDAGAKRVDVVADSAGEYSLIQRSGATIRADGAVCFDGGQFATVANTDKIVVTDTSGSGTVVGVDTFNGAFAPGATDEGDGDSEIEFEVVGGGGFDTLQLVGGNAGDAWSLGAVPGGSGVNLNAGSEPGAGADVDVTTTGVNKVTAAPGDGFDSVVAAGAGPFDGPLAIPALLYGGDQGDYLVGGSVTDELRGGRDDDTLAGGGGDDQLGGGAGKDILDGDAGADEADYELADGGVKVDLAVLVFQDTGGDGTDLLVEVEKLAGSKWDDELSGYSGGVNTLDGRGGNDVLEGRGGTDILDGGSGTDVASYAGAGSGVTVDLADGTQDTAGAGVDTLLGFEDVLGSAFADTLKGDGGGNALEGGGGADQVFGLGGADVLRVRDEIGDTADCGADGDTVVSDAPGVDVLIDCETVDATAAPVSPGDGGSGSGSGGSASGTAKQPLGGGAVARDTRAPIVAALRRRGGRLTFRLSERSRVSVVLSRRGANRRFRTVRRMSRSGVAGANRARLPRKLRRGVYRAVVIATDAAGNRSAKRSVRFRVR